MLGSNPLDLLPLVLGRFSERAHIRPRFLCASMEPGSLIFCIEFYWELYLKMVVGESAGDHGFPRPNPVFIRPEYPRLRLPAGRQGFG